MTIMGYSRGGQDKAQVAYLLWERCTIPAVLYGVEAMPLSKSTIAELNCIQNMVARFILPLPKSASLVAGFVGGGMKPTVLESNGAYMFICMEVLEVFRQAFKSCV